MRPEQHVKKALALAISTILFAPTTVAQSSDTEQQPVEETITVWGTQVKSSSVYLGTQAIATRQADHISDLLRYIPGVDVGGAHSLNQRITIRSMDDKDLKITIDGANQNTYMYHHMGNLQIHADILKSADIEVGNNSVLNGSLGGSARFETKTAEELLTNGETFGGRLQTGYGDNSGHNYALTGYGQLSNSLDILAYYNAVNRDNYRVGGDKILDADGVELPGTNGEVVGLEGEIYDSLVKFGWNIDADQRLSVSFERYRDEGNYSYRPDMGLATDKAITDSLQVPLLWPTQFGRDTLTLNYDLQWHEDHDMALTIFQNESELYRDESGWAQNPAYAGWAAKVTGLAENKGINLLANSQFGKNIEHSVNYGFNVTQYQTNYHALGSSGNLDKSKEQATHWSFAIEDRIDFGEVLALVPGLRYDRYVIDSKVVEDTFTKVSGALSAELTFTPELQLVVSTTGLFKGPEIGEVFIGAGLFDRENDNIEAESGRNSELTLAYDAKVLGADKFSSGFTLFKTQLDNYIYDYAALPDGGPRDTWKDNVGDMTIDGFEGYIGYQINALKLQLTYSDAKSELDAFSQYASLDGARLDRQQGATIGLSADYTFDSPNIALHWELQHVKGLVNALSLDGASKDTAKSGFNVHNLSLVYQPSQLEGLTAIFGIDNVFDEYYASQSSRTGISTHPRFGELYLLDYEPGRNIKATIAYKF